jgi:tRNA C32,U32 (ribose-2'-O)-methylase TrmJ
MRCNRLAYIPADPACSSLNLAAAVQVVGYEVRLAAGAGGGVSAVPEAEFACHEDVEKFYAHLERSLYASGFLHPRYPRRLMERLRRLFSRSRLEREELNILRGMLSQWDRQEKPGTKGDEPNNS